MARHGVDRLSSLPVDIRIRIISFLPLRLAIVAGCLSSPWRGLWKKVTSVDLTNRKLDNISKEFTTFSNVMSQIKSPFINSLDIELGLLLKYGHYQQTYDFSWLREICDRHVCNITLTATYGKQYEIITLPSFVFQTSSLVSVKLEAEIGWELPDLINLPNLKYLSLKFWTNQCKCVSKLIEACPSLEELSLNSDFNFDYKTTILRLSNPKLMHLTLNSNSRDYAKVVINTPLLRYLAISITSSVTLILEENLPELREAEIKLKGCSENHTTKFMDSIANVQCLTLANVTLRETSSVFRYATRVTLITYAWYSIENVLALMKLCPALDDLYLKYSNVDPAEEKSSVLWNGTLLRRLKRITIEIAVYGYFKPPKSCLKLVEYLFCNAINLKHFNFKIDESSRCQMWDAQQRHDELNFCKLLYDCPTLPVDCEVEFKGVNMKMSRKLGPKAWSTDGEVITSDYSPWKGFVL